MARILHSAAKLARPGVELAQQLQMMHEQLVPLFCRGLGARQRGKQRQKASRGSSGGQQQQQQQHSPGVPLLQLPVPAQVCLHLLLPSVRRSRPVCVCRVAQRPVSADLGALQGLD